MRGSRKLFLGSPRKNCVCREKGGSEAYFREFYYMNQKRFNFQGGDPPRPQSPSRSAHASFVSLKLIVNA